MSDSANQYPSPVFPQPTMLRRLRCVQIFLKHHYIICSISARFTITKLFDGIHSPSKFKPLTEKAIMFKRTNPTQERVVWLQYSTIILLLYCIVILLPWGGSSVRLEPITGLCLCLTTIIICAGFFFSAPLSSDCTLILLLLHYIYQVQRGTCTALYSSVQFNPCLTCRLASRKL